MTFYRLLQFTLAAAVLAALFCGFSLLRDPERFPIREVKVQASYQHLDQRALGEAITPFVNHGFFNLRPQQLKKRLLQFPWVAEAMVNRIWPDTVAIHITEQKAAAQLGNQQLVNEQGQLFSPPKDTFPAKLPVINGQPAQLSELMQTFQQMRAALAPLKLDIAELTADDRQALNLILTNGMKIMLGRTDTLLRLQRFVKVYPNIFTDRNKIAQSVDLRYQNGLAIDWQADQQKK